MLEYAPPGFGYEYGLHGRARERQLAARLLHAARRRGHFIQGRERELLAWYFWHWSHDPDAVPQADFEVYVRQLQKPGGLRGGFMHFATVWEDMALFKAWAAAGKLAMPVLALGGARGAGEFPMMAIRRSRPRSPAAWSRAPVTGSSTSGRPRSSSGCSASSARRRVERILFGEGDACGGCARC